MSVNVIGRQLGASGPALYRYSPSRDDLLTELAVDAYDDLAAALRDSNRKTPKRARCKRFEAFVQAYRAWANAQPHHIELDGAPGKGSEFRAIVPAGIESRQPHATEGRQS